MITLIAPGGESLHTLEGALDRLGLAHLHAVSPRQAAPAGALILLASGPYDGACAALKTAGWWRELRQMAADGRSVLGLNGGLHLLAEGSEEAPRGAGLGMLPGIVRRLGPGVKLPHLGWSKVSQHRAHPGLPDLRGGWLHFAHCHALEPSSETQSIAVHGRPFSVLEVRGKVLGLQAQVEKSGTLGLVLLARLLAGMGERPLAPTETFN